MYTEPPAPLLQNRNCTLFFCKFNGILVIYALQNGEVKAVVTFVQLGWVRLEIFKRKILN